MSRDFDLSKIGERYEFGLRRDDDYGSVSRELNRFKTLAQVKSYARLYRGSVFKPHPDGGYHLAKNCGCNLCSKERKARAELAYQKYLVDNHKEIEKCQLFYLNNFNIINELHSFSIKAYNDKRYSTESATTFRLGILRYIRHFGYEAGIELSINSPVSVYVTLEQLETELNKVLKLSENVVLVNPK